MIKTAEERIAVEGAYNHSDRVLNTVTVSFAKYHAMIEEAAELRAAYEALKAENEKALSEINRLVSLNDQFRANENRLISENEAQAKRIEEVKGFLEACVDDSMSRNNRQQLAGELLDMLNGDSK